MAIKRVPPGVPQGGQFAASRRSEQAQPTLVGGADDTDLAEAERMIDQEAQDLMEPTPELADEVVATTGQRPADHSFHALYDCVDRERSRRAAHESVETSKSGRTYEEAYNRLRTVQGEANVFYLRAAQERRLGYRAGWEDMAAQAEMQREEAEDEIRQFLTMPEGREKIRQALAAGDPVIGEVVSADDLR